MPSRSRARGRTGSRAAAVARGASLLAALLGLCASAALLAPPIATASGVNRPCAPTLGDVVGFHGTASSSFSAAVSGQGADGSVMVALDHKAANLRINVHKLAVSKAGTVFGGTATHGDVEIDDSLAEFGTGFSGTQTYSGSVSTHPPNYGATFLLVARRKDVCSYEFSLGFGANATFSGDEEVQAPTTEVKGSAESGLVHIPNSLHLSAAKPVPVYYSCEAQEDTVTLQNGCYEFAGGWATEFGNLFFCHSEQAEHCMEDTGVIGIAEMDWSLSPIYKKKKQKKH